MELTRENILLVSIIKWRLRQQDIYLYVAVLTDIVQNPFKIFLLFRRQLIDGNELREDINRLSPVNHLQFTDKSANGDIFIKLLPLQKALIVSLSA